MKKVLQYTIIGFVLTCLLSCRDKQEITLATANDNFIKGSLAGADFYYGSNYQGAFPSYYNTQEESDIPEENTPQIHGLKPGLVLSRSSSTERDGIKINLQRRDLRTLNYPVDFTNEDGLTIEWIQYYLDSSDPECPHWEAASTQMTDVMLFIESWREDQVVGQYAGTRNGAAILGSFSVTLLP
ncbi:MAG: hypothetical protein AAFU03_15665 [Bacteroidota bacterium]